ncbi:MAG: alpha/beta fold hydrolase [Bacteroidota bacterium]|nr:alpha/beta fold hydrolase [Bacteroidota bacterium]MDP3144383.1 alpha/beta fold hydrolase [Bacteroidota bacterium]MDP3555939.1 alpha/beta fold hydrolase [Bacteroidota bacterium]
MKRLKKIVFKTALVLISIYIVICSVLYFQQESMIFFPKKLSANYKFNYSTKFEEKTIHTSDKNNLNGLLFKSDTTKGLIFYLHGNSGALDTWGNMAETYTNLNYDLFILDYRGFGKSSGEISSEEQFYSDIQTAYNSLKTQYAENKIIIIGYSIGTGPAAMLAATNNPKTLILQAPYYSLIDMMHQDYPFIPNFLLKYKFETYEFVKKTKAPIIVFHGNADEVIYYGSSVKLEQHFKSNDRLITLIGHGHSAINENLEYRDELKKILNL